MNQQPLLLLLLGPGGTGAFVIRRSVFRLAYLHTALRSCTPAVAVLGEGPMMTSVVYLVSF